MSQSQVTVVEKAEIDGHRLAEFVYGIVTGMVAVAGIGTHPAQGWIGTAAIVVIGAVAIWLAHGYALMLSRRVTSGKRLTPKDVAETFAGSWPIVTAGILLAVPIAATGLGLWGLETGLKWSGYVGVILLLLVGLAAGWLTKETWPRRILIAVVYGALGVAVVAVEYIVHH